MYEPKIDFEINDDSEMILIVTCGNCGRVMREEFSALKAGSHLACLCGAAIEIQDADFSEAQKSLDELKRSLGKLGH